MLLTHQIEIRTIKNASHSKKCNLHKNEQKR